jgi:hypothetical protein
MRISCLEKSLQQLAAEREGAALLYPAALWPAHARRVGQGVDMSSVGTAALAARLHAPGAALHRVRQSQPCG